MQRINTWQDALPFSGKIVAYKTNEYYYQGDKPFSIDSSIGTQFAYVVDMGWDDQAQRYSMSRVLKRDSVPSGCLLWNELLEKNPIEMRLATDAEIAEIGKSVQADQAKFEYGVLYQERIDAILKKVFDSSESNSNK